jgi:hypothetical protein
MGRSQKRSKNGKLAGNFRRRCLRFLRSKSLIASEIGVSNDEMIAIACRHFSIEPPTNKIAAYALLAEKIGPQSPIRKRDGFYASDAWISLRYRALLAADGTCQCCGMRPSTKNPLHVDHIKPRSRYPALELEISNLQVLCRQCNLGKRAWDETDWRQSVSGELGRRS